MVVEITELDEFILLSFAASGILSFVLLFFIDAPYGKFASAWSIPVLTFRIDGKFGWFLQETPSALIPLLMFFYYYSRLNWVGFLFFALWELHYIHRAWYYPWFRVHTMGDTTFMIVLMAFFYTAINSYMNAKFLLAEMWVREFPIYRIILGVPVFLFGLHTNWTSEQILINLRRHAKKTNAVPDESGKYYIPEGGFFEYVSAAHYFGEIVEWGGLAIAFGTKAAWIFFFWNVCFLVPRAWSTHKWYLKTFKSRYPAKRKAVIPFLF
jgi:3-oxo-5-alpha-steroid 4-dehydrogenase 1